MRNKRRPAFLLFLGLLPLALGAEPVQTKVQDLAVKYQDWLDLVAYIITPIEKDVFLQLTSERDRDIFIDTFWKQRDPTPGTPENEYKEEHLKRIAYANKFYSRGTTRAGWKTDMGRIYITLGAPSSIEHFETTLGIIPCQAWSYYGDAAKDLPPHFILLFFQRRGVGEYKLYSPVSDGPSELIQDTLNIDVTDYEQMYDRIRELSPTLADISISLVPGEYYFGGYQPSPENVILLSKILESPQKVVSPTYATHFLDYKGYVSTEYLTNYVESETNVSLIADPVTGLSFIHFAIAPKTVSYERYEPKNQNYCDYRLDVSLRVGEAIIFQYNKEIPVYFGDDETERIKANGLSIEDSFPVIGGTYKMIVLLQNSVAKEFSLIEKDITVPAPSDAPKLNGPFLGYKFAEYGTEVHIPYKIQDKKLVVDPKNTFCPADQLAFSVNVINCTQELWRAGKINVEITGQRQANPAKKTMTLELATVPYNKILTLSQAVPVKELAPEYYEIKLTLVDEKGESLDETTADFIVSPNDAVPHPIAKAKGFPLSSVYLYHLMLARQYDKTGASEKAETQYEKVLQAAPDSGEGALDYANLLVKDKKYARALEVSDKFVGAEQFKFEALLVRGRAQMGLGNFGEAITTLLEGNKIYNSDIRLLNSLGICYYKTGEKTKALETLEASLRLNPNQEETKKLVGEIKKNQ
jgi:GWxTD domain-containing protein